MKNYSRFLVVSLACGLTAVGLVACGDSTSSDSDAAAPDAQPTGLCEGDTADTVRPEGWTAASHCNGVDADYDLVFDDTLVHRFDITVAPDVYQATLDDLEDILSGGGPGGGGDVVEDPMWVPVTVQYNGLTWSTVGMRYKGNSSLRSAWQMGIRKLSFRLTFDKFEDDTPEILNQRFFGFKKMTFSNGFKDDSLIRDKVAADIFREGGVPAARGAFARVYVDFGQGPVYFGLYTMIEDPSDKMLDTQFDDDNGNLYKPEGEGAKWVAFIEEHFEKKTNEEEADFSDIIAAIDALGAERSDAALWRQDLESVFNVAGFLKMLALNQTMVNWDSYGCMTHNYYLYADLSDDGRITWFPWDLNEAMLSSGGPQCYATSVMLDEVDDQWPLIRYLLDDPVYRQAYQDELQAAVDGPFASAAVKSRMQAHHDLIAPYVVGANGESAPYTFLTDSADFENSLTSSTAGLFPHVEARHAAVLGALGQ